MKLSRVNCLVMVVLIFVMTGFSGTCHAVDGDVNGDGTVDVFDALLVLQYSVGLYQPGNPDAFRLAADVAPLDPCGTPKSSGTTDVFDALAILRHAVSLDDWTGSICAASPHLQVTNEASDVTLSWLPLRDAISYNLYWSTGGGTPSSSWTKVTRVNSPFHLSSATAIATGKTYYISVAAVTSAGEGPLSEPVAGSATTSTTSGWSLIQETKGGEVHGMTVDPTNANRIYAGITYYASSGDVEGTGYVYTSADAGSTWSRTPLGKTIIYSIVADPSNPGTLYAGAGAAGPDISVAGVYKSTDGGSVWKQLLSGHYVYSLTIDPQNPSLVLAGTQGEGIYRTADAGQNWEAVTSGLPDAGGMPEDVYDFGFSGDRVYCLAAQSGIYQSRDNGLTWGVTGLTEGPSVSMAVSRQTPATIYVGVGGPFGEGQATMRKSTDGGATWQTLNGVSSAYYLQSTVLLSNSPDWVYVASDGMGVKQSTDGGVTWQDINQGLPDGYPMGDQSLVLNPFNPKILFAGTREGLYYTNSGGQ